MKDKVKVTLTFERNKNGTVSRQSAITGSGFHYFEIIGLIQMASYEFAVQSKETAKEMPEGPTKIEFKDPEPE